MDDQPRDLALLALSLLHGDDAPVDEEVEPGQLAEGQAYLNGVAVQALAQAMGVPIPEAVAYLRRLLTEVAVRLVCESRADQSPHCRP